VKNHALVDGNKRLGWLATAVFLEINGVPVTHVGNDDVYEFVIAVTVGREEVAEIAALLSAGYCSRLTVTVEALRHYLVDARRVRRLGGVRRGTPVRRRSGSLLAAAD
jgi:prophage maintenance system killer protein